MKKSIVIIEKDSLFNQSAALVVSAQAGSTSLLQRKLKLGYMRAGRIMSQLEQAGIVGEFNNAAPRKVLVKNEDDLKPILENVESDTFAD